MKNLTDIFLKARSGVYKDTSENRRLHRVGQKYGESKQPEDFEEAIEKFSEMFYDGESSEKLKRYLDSRLGEGTYDRISKETSSRQFEESSERKDYFMGKVEDAFLNKKAQSVNPAKELEAVNKVISAIAAGKINLPNQEVVKLYEKRRKLEEAKTQAEKINAGVKANEEKRNVKEVKETNKKINEASKRKKKYGDMNVEEAKKELLGKDLTITDIETGKTRTEKITSILEGNVRGHETIMARVEGGGTYPIKHIDTGKEWKAWKLNLNSSSKETKSEPKKERVTLDGWVSNSFSDVKDYGDKGRVVSMSVSAVPDFEKMKYVYVAAVGSSHVLPEDADKFLKESNDLNKKTFDSPNEAAKAADEFAEKWNKKEVKAPEQKSSSTGLSLDSIKESVQKEFGGRFENGKYSGGASISFEEKDGEITVTVMDRGKSVKDKLENIAKKLGVEGVYDKEESGSSSTVYKFQTKKELDNLKGSDKTGGNEEKETYTRVKFDDLPNSGKVNLKKYLSDKVKRTADENLGILSKVSTENLKKMETGLVKEFNSQFDDLPKSRRAEKLYSIMKVKAELENRSKRQFDEFKTHTESLDDNALLAEGYQIGEEARKIHNRGFKNFEEQHEAQKVLKELEMKRQINENEQHRRMKLLDEKK